jgi:peptide-methionine (S)-S-oxide reductase
MADQEIAILGGGCFWCLDAVFDRLRGVTSVESGYTGGRIENPTYRQVCGGDTGHVEVVRVTFDPAQITFADLLEVFFAIHDPTQLNRQGNDVGEQYRSVIFYTSEDQHRVAEETVREMKGEYSAPIVTALEPAGKFYVAEDYHQEYFANNARQPYCQAVVAPKVRKALEKFGDKMGAARPARP